MKMSTSEIFVGDRIRKDVDTGIQSLCKSIQELGQLQPVLVDADWNLVSGARRLRACGLLGIEVEVYQAKNKSDLLWMLKAERDENTCRIEFTPSEMVAMSRKIEEEEKPKAADRKKETQAKPGEQVGSGAGNFPSPIVGRAADIAARALGRDRRTIDKAKVVVDEAAKPDALPEVVQAMQEMDRTGKITPAFKIVKAIVSPVKEVIETPVEQVIELPVEQTPGQSEQSTRSIPDEWPEIKIKTFGAIRKYYTKTPEFRTCIITDVKRFLTELQKQG